MNYAQILEAFTRKQMLESKCPGCFRVLQKTKKIKPNLSWIIIKMVTGHVPIYTWEKEKSSPVAVRLATPLQCCPFKAKISDAKYI